MSTADFDSVMPHRYLVRVGHNQVTVVCQTAAEAIQRAKTQLRHDFPRLWDVISSLSESKFEVQDLDQPSS
ncbi:hypothetical protein DTL21_23605 [Bremerella cremea]|uniref:Uncharacterized protein n=1 Tax=Blastopirellula marina TaxID=124 RepID=A0A2S8FDV5_9BACT|nr:MULTISPECIES: hypothetical protein [Pirellulaceae]PQO30348.1 hypothetical protein C5Y83_23570 [Blastopirellula marina]RCS43699.1 hypothetical protein DTL21_23605 [Bremerella cremea]